MTGVDTGNWIVNMFLVTATIVTVAVGIKQLFWPRSDNDRWMTRQDMIDKFGSWKEKQKEGTAVRDKLEDERYSVIQKDLTRIEKKIDKFIEAQRGPTV